MRAWARRALIAFLGGTLIVGAAWAGVGLGPSPRTRAAVPKASVSALKATAALAAQSPADPLQPPDLTALDALPDGQFLVGASVTSLAPDPAKWQTKDCVLEDESQLNDPLYLVNRAAEGHIPPGWPKSPNCIYLGGYGIGPGRVATSVDRHSGVNVRSLAISNGSQLVVWQMIDAVGYFAKYRADLCADCGILDMRRRIGAAIGMPAANVAIGSTHTHGGFDGYGAWGGIPDWYRTQIRDAVIRSAFDAVRAMQPAQLEIGDVNARDFSGQRRDTYYSANDYGAVWLQARRLGGGPEKSAGQVIATLVNYAAHPTYLGGQPVMHGDWPATGAKGLGEQLGGVGLVFEGGLGNVSENAPRGATGDYTRDGKVDDYDHVIQMGNDFAAFVARAIAKGGHVLVDNAITAVTVGVQHPGTNVAEVGGTVAGLLDREFAPRTDGAGGPGVYVSRRGFVARKCVTGSATMIKTDVSGFRIGDLIAITAPGEIFGGISTVTKSQLRRKSFSGGQTMVFGQTQDSLGYIIQSYEIDPVGGLASNVDTMGLGDVAEYEEEFMVDNCFGDNVLETMLNVGRNLG